MNHAQQIWETEYPKLAKRLEDHEWNFAQFITETFDKLWHFINCNVLILDRVKSTIFNSLQFSNSTLKILVLN